MLLLLITCMQRFKFQNLKFYGYPDWLVYIYRFCPQSLDQWLWKRSVKFHACIFLKGAQSQRLLALTRVNLPLDSNHSTTKTKLLHLSTLIYRDCLASSCVFFFFFLIFWGGRTCNCSLEVNLWCFNSHLFEEKIYNTVDMFIKIII